MPQIFAVTRTRGPAFNRSLSLEEQIDWTAHAAFMNALHGKGFVLLGGPLEGTQEVLLIVHARDTNEIQVRLSTDPWTVKDLLRIKQIAPWNVRLGSVGPAVTRK
jgi:uncharacterized protein YciI